jgi:uncharacterized membrane protein
VKYFLSRRLFLNMSRSLTTIVLIALCGSLLTAVQILLVLFRGEAACIGDGCRIVENLTTVPPVLFNIAGLFFFQVVLWGAVMESRSPGRPIRMVKLILLAGMACEGVLVSFQYYISEAFCLYCLVILALVLLLNVSLGSRQTGTGMLIFFSVFIVFASLQFKSAAAGQTDDASLARGTYGLRQAEGNGPQLSLFFSSSCRYCEEVIASLKERPGCSVRFQPVEKIGSLDFPGVQLAPEYSPDINRSFLETLGIDQIPVLMAKDAEGIRILKGEGAISGYLDLHCPVDSPAGGTAGSSPSKPASVVPLQDDGSCTVSADCGEGTSRQPAASR